MRSSSNRAKELKKRPEILAGGTALTDWILDGGPFDAASGVYRALLRWNAYWFERHLRQSSARSVGDRRPIDPVFIVGLWRTGSTALHGMLTAQRVFVTPNTWQCFHPAHFQLVPTPRDAPVLRPMDGYAVTTRSPQEDEFSSLLLGEESFYRAFIDPRGMAAMTGALGKWRSPSAGYAQSLTGRWDSFLHGVRGKEGGRLLLKSPNHTFRLPWISSRFPAARFIWLVRDSTEVYKSNLRMWGAMIDRYALWECPKGAVEAFVAEAMRCHDEILTWATETMASRIKVVDFREVVDPLGRGALIASLLQYLQATEAPES